MRGGEHTKGPEEGKRVAGFWGREVGSEGCGGRSGLGRGREVESNREGAALHLRAESLRPLREAAVTRFVLVPSDHFHLVPHPCPGATNALASATPMVSPRRRRARAARLRIIHLLGRDRAVRPVRSRARGTPDRALLVPLGDQHGKQRSVVPTEHPDLRGTRLGAIRLLEHARLALRCELPLRPRSTGDLKSGMTLNRAWESPPEARSWPSRALRAHFQ